MGAGRPSKYNPAMQERAEDYLEQWDNDGDVIPTKAGLALWLSINLTTIDEWESDPSKPEFTRVLAQVKVKQQSLLLNKGLAGEFHSPIAKLLLSKHGIVEQTEQTTTFNVNHSLSNDDLDAKILRLQHR